MSSGKKEISLLSQALKVFFACKYEVVCYYYPLEYSTGAVKLTLMSSGFFRQYKNFVKIVLLWPNGWVQIEHGLYKGF